MLIWRWRNHADIVCKCNVHCAILACHRIISVLQQHDEQFTWQHLNSIQQNNSQVKWLIWHLQELCWMPNNLTFLSCDHTTNKSVYLNWNMVQLLIIICAMQKWYSLYSEHTYYTTWYDTVYLRVLKSRQDSQISLAHSTQRKNEDIKTNKLAPYATGGRILLTANFKVTWHKK